MFEGKTFLPQRFVDEVLGQVPDDYLITPISEKGGDVIYRYQHEGYFKPDGVPWLESLVRNKFGEEVQTGYISPIIKLMQVSTYCFDSVAFEEDKDHIILESGALNIFTRELKPHSPEYRSLSRIPVKYDPEAKCPRILAFLEDVCPHDIPSIQEWIGYHLMKNYRFQKMVMLLGVGANGKSTLLLLVEAFLGKENVSNVPLYQLTSNRFAPSELFGKLANIAPDISEDELERTGMLKALTGGDKIRAEKKHQNAFYFFNHAKLAFSANKLPVSPDQSQAFFRRWMIWEFNNVFDDERGNCDPNILDSLTTREELSGLLNWALDGLDRLIKQGGFSKSETTEEIRRKYERMAEPFTAFRENCLDEEPDGEALYDHVFTAHNAFCRNNGYISLTKTKLTQELTGQIWPLKKERYTKAPRDYYWKGLNLRCDETREECDGCSLYTYPKPSSCDENRDSCKDCPTCPTCPTFHKFFPTKSRLENFLQKELPELGHLGHLGRPVNPSLQTELKRVLDSIREGERINEGAINEEDFYKLKIAEGYTRARIEQLVGVLIEPDNMVFRPVPGFLKTTEGSP